MFSMHQSYMLHLIFACPHIPNILTYIVTPLAFLGALVHCLQYHVLVVVSTLMLIATCLFLYHGYIVLGYFCSFLCIVA